MTISVKVIKAIDISQMQLAIMQEGNFITCMHACTSSYILDYQYEINVFSYIAGATEDTPKNANDNAEEKSSEAS